MPRKGRKKASGPSMDQIVAAVNAVTMTPRSKPRKSRRKRKKNNGSSAAQSSLGQQGVITLAREELFAEVVLAANATSGYDHVKLVPASLSFLNPLAKCFDEIVWNSVSFHYKPAVGTNWGGLVTLGFDWNFDSAASKDRKYVSGLTPNMTTSAWGDTQGKPLVLPPNRLMSRRYYSTKADAPDFDSGPGKLCWAVSGTAAPSKQVVGEVWCRYSVKMLGTNPSAS